jgi:sarcosine oxidase
VPSAVVVGAGIFGASLARRLCVGGWDVTLVEQYPPGHVRAASGGESRLIRFSHGADVWYTRSAWRAKTLWRELEAEAGVELLVESGVLWLAHAEDGWEAESERILRDEGIPVERLDPGDVTLQFPSFVGDDLLFALFEPEAGVLRARDATRVVVEQALRSGVRFVGGTAHPAEAMVEVAGERLEADHVVWACGAWLAQLFPELVDIRVTKQDVFFFGGDLGWRTPPVPAWVDYEGAVYGVGDLDGRGVKVAPDQEGPQFDPDSDPRTPSREAERLAREYVRRRFPALAEAPLVGTRTCPYALTADTNFIIAAHLEYDGVWLLGGGSGHGFKHGPALAEYVARLLEGREEPDPRFGLGAREALQSLRTAGTRAR